ncbi:type II toxin-antitoxin system RelE/ParE family toxin [Ruegeria sp. EL01]|uniref:type II toxin-antitoxin system RelE family toxin n=1 Tax=Ruegeria sp. EL01 TaxID=2107578 RepID=UPI000EA821B7|nr:type II toxin-antitoxin system RelE/ParE family toxin [Ruegeria sp. EL01]
MTYSLEFHPKALKEFKALPEQHRTRLKDKLAERQENPNVRGDKLSGYPNRYKIKLMRPPLRLVYEVDDSTKTVRVLVVDKRERSKVYRSAARRY